MIKNKNYKKISNPKKYQIYIKISNIKNKNF